MVIAGLILLSSALINVKPSPVLAEVSIGSAGPYRFLVDTGAQTSFIDSKLAGKLHLKPEFRVEIVTQNSARPVPALKLSTLHIGGQALPEMELVFHDLSEARRLDSSIQGVLGLNALAGFDFTLSPRAGRLDLTAARPRGEVVPFYRLEDRIALKARMGRETLTLILDSGASHVALFRTPEAMQKSPPLPAELGTLEGARNVVPTCWTADMFFTDSLRVGVLPAAMVRRPDSQVDGLLPASVFKTIFVDQGRGEVVLVR